MKHDWFLNGDKEGVFEDDYDSQVDIFRVAYGFHNGPECKRCGASFCHHCEPDCYQQECSPSKLRKDMHRQSD